MATGDIITAEKLNHIEDGVDSNSLPNRIIITGSLFVDAGDYSVNYLTMTPSEALQAVSENKDIVVVLDQNGMKNYLYLTGIYSNNSGIVFESFYNGQILGLSGDPSSDIWTIARITLS